MSAAEVLEMVLVVAVVSSPILAAVWVERARKDDGSPVGLETDSTPHRTNHEGVS